MSMVKSSGVDNNEQENESEITPTLTATPLNSYMQKQVTELKPMDRNQLFEVAQFKDKICFSVILVDELKQVLN